MDRTCSWRPGMDRCGSPECGPYVCLNWYRADNDLLAAIDDYRANPSVGNYEALKFAALLFRNAVSGWWRHSLSAQDREFLEACRAGTWKKGDYAPSWGWRYLPDDLHVSAA